MRYIFLSYTGFIGLLERGKLTEEMIASSLMFFGCSRRHALWTDYKSWNEANSLHGWAHGCALHLTTVDAILAAEKDDRASWRKDDDGKPTEDPFYMLFALLRMNGANVSAAETAYFRGDFKDDTTDFAFTNSTAEKIIDMCRVDGFNQFKAITGYIPREVLEVA